MERLFVKCSGKENVTFVGKLIEACLNTCKASCILIVGLVGQEITLKIRCLLENEKLLRDIVIINIEQKSSKINKVIDTYGASKENNPESEDTKRPRRL